MNRTFAYYRRRDRQEKIQVFFERFFASGKPLGIVAALWFIGAAILAHYFGPIAL